MGDCRETIGGLSSAPGGNRVVPAQFDDLTESGLGTRLDSSSGKLAYNLALKGIDFADSTSIAADADKLHFGYQFYHRFKMDGEVDFHIHWIQAQAAVPNWWMRWRIWKNGGSAGAWTSIALDTSLFTYTAGTIMQITKGLEIDLATVAPGGKLSVSDFIDVEITRDATNASTLFAGADPVSGDVTARAFDPHVQVDSSGSDLEFEKRF